MYGYQVQPIVFSETWTCEVCQSAATGQAGVMHSATDHVANTGHAVKFSTITGLRFIPQLIAPDDTQRPASNAQSG